jgi:hypothetical protein
MEIDVIILITYNTTFREQDWLPERRVVVVILILIG